MIGRVAAMLRGRARSAASPWVKSALLGLAVVALAAFALTWSPGRGSDLLLVADLRGQALVVLDPARPEESRRIPLPGGPHELLHLPDGRVLVSLEQAGALALVEVARSSVEVVATGGTPHGLALSGETVLVTDRSIDAVRRFALDGWGELEPIQVGRWPHALAVRPNGGLAVTSADPGSVLLDGFEVGTGRTTESVAVRSDGAVAAAAASDGVVVLLGQDGATLGRWEVGGRPVRVAFAPDGRTLAVALSAAGAVALIDGNGVRYIAVEGVPDGLTFSSDGGLVYASDVYGGSVSAVDLGTGEVRAVFAAGEAAGALLVTAR